MKDVLLRVGVHTLEVLIVLGVSALVVVGSRQLGLGGNPSDALGVISAGVLAALAKFYREMQSDYVNGIGK